METPQVGSCKVRNLEVKIRIAPQTPNRQTYSIVNKNKLLEDYNE